MTCFIVFALPKPNAGYRGSREMVLAFVPRFRRSTSPTRSTTPQTAAYSRGGRQGLKKLGSGKNQLGFPGAGGSLALAPSGEFCW
jgi:hypothetical protein